MCICNMCTVCMHIYIYLFIYIHSIHYDILYIRSPIQVAQVLHATPNTLQRDDKVNELHQKCNPVSDQVGILKIKWWIEYSSANVEEKNTENANSKLEE